MSNLKDIQFPSATYEQWKEQAIKALKGKPFESLFTKTIEDITLEPLYTQESLVTKLGEKLEKQISTIRTLNFSDEFQAAQQVFGETSEQFFANLEDGINRGNKVITIDSRVSFDWNEESLTQLARYFAEYSFKLVLHNTKDPIVSVFEKIDDAIREKVNGYIITNESFELDNYPNVRTISANTLPYHYEGANAVQELALALALAAKSADKEENFEEFSRKFFVHFAIDTQFFSEIAKLRAFKVLWKAFAAAYGIEANLQVPVLAETSLRSFSKYDVYVNLLRAGNEAFAALIGGADVLTVHPHDVLTAPTDQSIRIARNVVLVLNEESYVANVLDPSGGSYYIESLTADYVEKAWNLFLEIQEAGGIDQYAASGKLHAALEEVNNKRVQAVNTRKHSLIGTNIYANSADELPKEVNPLFADVKRVAQSFEDLRERYSQIQPKVAVLTFGKLKDFKPRADFIAGFFATAGIVPTQSGAIETVEGAVEWLKNTDATYVVLAATDDDAKAIVPTLLDVKREGLLLDVAGRYKEEEAEWQSKGLNGFIFAGQDIVEKLNTVAHELKEVQR